MIKLRYYQEECAPKIISLIDQGETSTVIALPTGAGKTYTIADVIKKVRERYGYKVLILSHVKEILQQNYKSLSSYLPDDIGINSSMLGRREVKDITVAGIQSVFRSPELFKSHKLIIIDECHLVSPEEGTMYQKFFDGIGKHITIGLTATPFRLGYGLIYGPGKVFNSIAVNYTSKENYQKLIDEGYLSKLTTKRTDLEMDTSGIKLIAGDFSEKDLSDKFDRNNITNEAMKEVISAGENRKAWLIFAIDISHAEHIAEVLIRNGIPTGVIHSKMKEYGFDRDKIISGFKDGKYRCVVNVNILTTGFDHPHIDLIACLRPTNSPTLHVQSLGRGSRPLESKANCLVLDFAGNTKRLGPINDVLIKVKGKGGEGGDPITKTCPDCKSILPPAVRICPDCGHKFVFEHGLSANADRNNQIIDDGKPAWLNVKSVEYTANKKFGSPSSVKIDYKCDGRQVAEYVCVEHKGFAKHKADHWIKFRGGEKCNTIDDLIKQKDILRVPTKVLVQKKGKYYSINDAKFKED